ncbi:MAG: efflux RND transporter permease subunit, partial [Candidatus Poribacteria bacterium]|nr:efflux RND transporter permease subunit [Candidatus Poribacteria bacterium]
GRDVEVKDKGERYQEMTEIAEKLMDELRGMPGVYDVQNDYTVGKEEFRVRLNAEKARQYGLTVVQLAQMVRGAVDGLTATTYRDVDDAVDVLIKYRPDRMATREDLEAMVVQTPSGEAVPLRSIATIEDARGISEIRRFEGERAVSVFAAVDTSVTSAVAVNDVLINAFADIETLYPGYRLDFRGVFDQINESFADLGKLFIVGILVIYVILGAQFKSFGQPFIIMCAVPFGIMGAMFGLLAVQATLSMVAMFGIVALSGIVVNDSIVLLDFINKYRARGFVRNRAILKAGFVRLRPIILTSMTTIGGLIPMAIGLGGKSPIWMPLASTIIFGMSSATLLTLFMMPALYAILTDMSEWRMRRRQTAQGGTT